MRNFEKFEKEILEISLLDCNFALVGGKPLRCGDAECKECAFNNEICNVGRIKWLYQEYVEKPKLTKQERKFCELFEDEDLWFARQRNMTMPTIFMHKPYKTTTCWHGDTIQSCELRKYCNARLDFIKWEDEEPWSVEDLLKLEVEE